MKEADRQWIANRDANREHNVRIADGVFVNGIYRDHGVPRLSHEREAKLEKGGTIYEAKIK